MGHFPKVATFIPPLHHSGNQGVKTVKSRIKTYIYPKYLNFQHSYLHKILRVLFETFLIRGEAIFRFVLVVFLTLLLKM